jgi:hypothetical protein
MSYALTVQELYVKETVPPLIRQGPPGFMSSFNTRVQPIYDEKSSKGISSRLPPGPYQAQPFPKLEEEDEAQPPKSQPTKKARTGPTKQEREEAIEKERANKMAKSAGRVPSFTVTTKKAVADQHVDPLDRSKAEDFVYTVITGEKPEDAATSPVVVLAPYGLPAGADRHTNQAAEKLAARARLLYSEAAEFSPDDEKLHTPSWLWAKSAVLPLTASVIISTAAYARTLSSVVYDHLKPDQLPLTPKSDPNRS